LGSGGSGPGSGVGVGGCGVGGSGRGVGMETVTCLAYPTRRVALTTEAPRVERLG